MMDNRSTLATLDATTLRQAFACFPSGVTAICGLNGDKPLGMSASSFASVSLDPPLVSVCMATTSSTWSALRLLPRLGVSVLAENHDVVCRSLASKSGDRFADVDWTASPDGAVFVQGSALWIECSIEDELPAGDHVIALLRILAVEAFSNVPPLVFHGSRFRQLVAA